MTDQTPTPARVRELLEQMTLEEKLAQIVGFWEDKDGEVVAPLQGELRVGGGLEAATKYGIGHLTRVYGTSPIEPVERAAWLWRQQRQLVRDTRLGIPALVHEECLTGLSAWKAATFPTPLAWGAAFDPELVAQMGALIGVSMRELGIHQGLAPVLDLVRDARWGRAEECIGEDPYLVATIGSAYVQGMQGAGVHATLKHFVGYSASRAGRNLAPVYAGPREVADVLMVPFEIAVLDGGARAVMHSYAEIDGVPVAADPRLLTGVLRDQWGFDGVVVADYFGIAFLQILHGVAADLGEAAAQALVAGVDIELPTGDAYLAPLAEAVRSGAVDEAYVDRAVVRALRQKHDLGLLDASFDEDPPSDVVLDGPEHRRVARRLAESSIVLLSNDGTLPLLDSRAGSAPDEPGTSAGPGKIAVIGPNADRPAALFGCYSFANHVLSQHPGVEMGFEVPTIWEAVQAEFGAAQPSASATEFVFARGCGVDDEDRTGFSSAVEAATQADVALLVVGDQAGLFGRGTVGEGCDRDDLELPGVQRELVEAVLATGTPVVLVLVTGRPYAVAWALDACAAVIQAFFPGEEGAAAVAGVLSGRVNPSGRLPVSLPRSGAAQPYSYLHPTLGGNTEVSSLDPSPALPFGHGLSYTTFSHTELTTAPSVTTDGDIIVSVRVTNTGQRSGDDVVQLYARDVVGSVTRPLAQLLGYRRVSLAAGDTVTVRFDVPTTRLAFSDRAMRRVVEPGLVELWVGPSAQQRDAEGSFTLVGDPYLVTVESRRLTVTELE